MVTRHMTLVRGQNALWAALLLNAFCCVGWAATAETVTLEVAAGECDRQDVAVATELPAALRRHEHFTLLRLDTGEATAVQVDRIGVPRVCWIVRDELPAQTTRRYRLTASTEKPNESGGVSVADDGKHLTVRIASKPVLTYNCAVVASPNPKEPYYARSGYIHPLVSPSGKVVTDDFNPDHAHQHGIMFAWRKTTCEGRTTNGWDQKAGLGKVEHVKVEGVGGGPVFGFFAVRLHHLDLTAPGGPKPILDEVWRVRVENHSDRFLVDLESTQNCASKSPVTVDEMHYGGLMIRGGVSWSKQRNFDYLTSDGKTNKDGNHTRPRWADLSGPIEDGACGVLALDHPSNFRFPQPVRLHPTMPYFCFTPAVLGSFAIEAGKPYVSQYRFVVYDGRIVPKAAERLWTDYANPPRVRVVDEKGSTR